MKAPLSASVFAAADRRLRVWFSTTGLTGSLEQLAPDYAIGAVPFALNAETLDGLDSSAFAGSAHTRSGANIISGTVADARYARCNPTPQQIALLKWYTAITDTGSTFAVGARPLDLAFDGAFMWVANSGGNTVGKR